MTRCPHASCRGTLWPGESGDMTCSLCGRASKPANTLVLVESSSLDEHPHRTRRTRARGGWLAPARTRADLDAAIARVERLDDEARARRLRT